MTRAAADPILLRTAIAFCALALACGPWLLHHAPPILGLHPAIKPLKFAISIAIFFATLAWLLPRVSLGETGRAIARWTLVAAMTIEMAAIAGQALRGRTSHFNTATWLDALAWNAMLAAILAITGVMAWVAIAASVRALAATPMLALASRAALWLFLLSALSGFAMGGRAQHTVGGNDGSRGIAFVNWSTRHGDLRIAHFVAMHALQTLPIIGGLAAAAVDHAALPDIAGWALVIGAIVLQASASIWTLVCAFGGRPPW